MSGLTEVDLPDLEPKNKIKFLNVEEFMSNTDAVLLDVRSPSEYKSGHIDGALSFPLFDDEERAEVGTIYKKIGRDQAVEKGLFFVGKKLHNFVRQAKTLGRKKQFYLYCWRGGMRSNSLAWLLSVSGFNVSLLNGGYKAYRNTFNDYVDKDWKFIVILGNTGIGKTELLDELSMAGEQVLDLERLANHKGSVFGSFGLGEQPSTEEFINRIHQKLRSFDTNKTVWVEGESISIGSCFIPNTLYSKIASAPYITAKMSRQERIERLTVEYGCFSVELVETAFNKVTKRMGANKVNEAIEAFKSGDVAHSIGMALDYYDKGYEMAASKHTGANLGVVTIENNNHAQIAKQLINGID